MENNVLKSICKITYMGFPCGTAVTVVKNPAANAGDPRDVGPIPELGRSSRRGNGSLLQDSCLGNPMDRRPWQDTVHGVTKSQTGLSTPTHNHIHMYIYWIWRRQWQPTPVLLPGKSHGPRSLVGYNLWGFEESDTTEQLHFHFYFHHWWTQMQKSSTKY